MQLSSYENITQDNIIFNEAKEFKVKDSKIKYKRIPIEIKYPNGKKGALVIETPLLFSFGVNEKKNQETGKLVGYSMPVCLWSKDSVPNPKELSFFETLSNVVSMCRYHLGSEYGEDYASSLSSPFYYKQIEYTDKKGKKKTKVDESSALVLYAKLIYSSDNFFYSKSLLFCFLQFLFVERTLNFFSCQINNTICNRFCWKNFINYKYLLCPVWCVALIKYLPLILRNSNTITNCKL